MRRLLLVIILGLVLSVGIGGQTSQPENLPILISSTHISTELQLGKQSDYSLDIHFTPISDTTELTITFPFTMTEAMVKIDSLVAATALSQLESGTFLRITPSQNLSVGTDYQMSIQSKIHADVSEIETGTYQYLFDWNTNLKSDNVTFRLYLPKYASVHYEGGQASIFPNQATFVSDGQRIGLVWTGLSNTGSLNTKIFVEFELQTTVEPVTNPITTVIIVLLSACLLLLGYLYYKVRFRTKQVATENPDDESITRVITQVRPMILSPQELEILEMIASYNGGILQSDLVDALNYSRARVSQYLSSFEEKGLITKHKAGRQNYVTIASDVLLKPKESNESNENE